MPRGASPKREREYEELKEKFEQEGRYQGREKEVASRIVNKQRAGYGETKGEKQQERGGKSPDRNLPVQNYRRMDVGQVKQKAPRLSPQQIDKVERYEKEHKHRKGAIEGLEREKRKKAA